jgi:hypothetical protein
MADQHPRFGRQAFVWALTLLTYGGEDAEALVVHTVNASNLEYMQILQSWGVAVRVVERFDARHPNSNKLAQLDSAALHDADFVVLCDCDTAFCSSISSWVRGEAVRARIGSYNGLAWEHWEELFAAADLPLPAVRKKALLNGVETLPSYCNGGLYIIPQNLFQKLREAWPRWDRWLLDRPALLRPFVAFADQISFAMSCEELRLEVDHLPLEMNCDGVFHAADLRRVTGRDEIRPLVLHYHHLDQSGLVPTKKTRSINRQVRKINDLIRFAERVNFDISSLLLLRERRTA